MSRSRIDPAIVAAHAEAAEAKRQLLRTIDTLRARLSPAYVAREAREALQRSAREQVQARPAVIAGTAGAASLLLLHRPLLRLARRLISRRDATQAKNGKFTRAKR